MSDYGFATYDEKNPKKRLGTINSKWPIFGPKYADIGRAFKTIHIVDTYTPNYKTGAATPSIPSGGYYGTTEKRWAEKQLIHQFEHGYNFRPVGYATFSGSLVINVKCTITQNEVITGNTSPYGGNFTLNGLATQTIPLLPDVRRQMKASYVSTTYSPVELAIGNYFFGIDDSNGYGGYYRRDIIVPNSCIGAIKRDYTVAGYYEGEPDAPYKIEIDDKYVKIYRNVFWLDFWLKWYSSYTSSYSQYNYTHSINDRIKGATYYTGSDIDCTIYLAPYSLEDLI